MAGTLKQALNPIGSASRNVVALLVSGAARRIGVDDARDRIAALGFRDQALVVGGTLGLLLLLSLFAAQFGIVGMLLFFLAIIVIAR